MIHTPINARKMELQSRPQYQRVFRTLHQCDYTGATALLDGLPQPNGCWRTGAMMLTDSGRPWKKKGSNPVFRDGNP